jgi:amidohydrolase
MKEANQIKDELLEIRRTLHQNPEVGASLPCTKAFVMDKLREYGYEPEEICESGIVADLKGGRSLVGDLGGRRLLLLRADMDALAIEEKTGLPFASKNGCMHACGQDMHTAMLLGAAKLLKAHESQLAGDIRFVFQPNEEGFEGAKAMVAAGVLENPRPDAGMALHVTSAMPSGLILAGKGVTMASCRFFRIKVRGTGCHGAMPETGVDPINIATHIYLSLQEIIARETSAVNPATLTIGSMHAGKAPNIIPEEAVMEGSIRTLSEETAEFIYQRIREVAVQTAALFRGQAQVEEICFAPPLKNDPALVEEMVSYAKELQGEQGVILYEQAGMGSEDFAIYTHEIPCAYLLIGAGTEQEDVSFGKPMHNEGVVFNEDIMTTGAALLAHCALRYFG